MTGKVAKDAPGSALSNRPISLSIHLLGRRRMSCADGAA